MATKILCSGCLNNLLTFVPRFLKKDVSELFKRFGNISPCHTNSPDNFSPLLENIEVQKYLNFIQNERSYLKSLGPELSENLTKLLQAKAEIEMELKNLGNMSSEGDEELEKLKEEEKKTYLTNKEKISCEIIKNVIPYDEVEENRDVEIQIIPAIGGDEAKLFAEELFNMYLNFVKFKNWELLRTEIKGQKTELQIAYIMVSGERVFNHFKYEAGVHRVQRVPETEKTGRTHTSTCSVAVLPQPHENEIVIKPKDIIIEKMRSSGPGGQNVNKTESCVRIKHIPSGVVVENQTSRFQYENKAIAFQKLRGILFNMEQEKIQAERKALKKQQVGTNDYSDKIRTYHFNQNRVTDHRINYTVHNIKDFLEGERQLNEMILMLDKFSRKELFLGHVAQVLESVEYRNFAKGQVSN